MNRTSWFSAIAATVIPAMVAGCASSLESGSLVRAISTLDNSAQKTELSTPKSDAVRPNDPRRPVKNVLVLSSGGLNGAYAAGVLKGWTQTQRRPEFDVVTGVSTGALLGTFAFLGPEFDDELEASYTKIRPWDVFHLTLLFPWSDALANSDPLRERIEREVTPQLLDQIAAEHRRGRRLFVGTTRLESKELVIWDMGAIASGSQTDKLKLFQTVLLASCSIPGLLPPVPIEIEEETEKRTELHVDGSVAASLFLQPSLLGVNANGVCPESSGELAGTNIYVIVAGKIRSQPGMIRRTLFRLSGESLEGVLQSRLEGDLLRTYLLCRHTGAGFQLAAIPPEFDLGSNLNSVTIGPEVLRRLFDLALKSTRDGKVWLEMPPGVGLDQQAVPRTGTRIDVPSQPSLAN